MRNALCGLTVIVLWILALPAPAQTAGDHRPVTVQPATAPIHDSSGNAPTKADFETLNFRDSAACSPCHGAGETRDALENDTHLPPVMYDQWSASIMAYGSKDPFWQAKVRSEVLRAPEDLREFIEGKCSTCHTPMATTEAKKADETPVLFDDGFLNPDNPLHAAAMDSISCTLCHRIEDSDDLGTDAGFSGGYVIASVEVPVDRPHFGRYEDTFDQPMRSSVGLLNQYGRQISAPELCATCHNLKTPYLDGNLEPAGEGFPEQMPYSEWLESDFADSNNSTECQECHMSPEDRGNLAISPGWLEKRFRASHAFTSANTEILSLLAAETADAGGDPTALIEAADAGRRLLTRAGGLEVLDRSFENGLLEFELLVENATGHKLPTAFPSRRVYLHVVVSDAGGVKVFESGAMTDNGQIMGDDSNDDPNTFEPHHTTIELPGQVQIYESVLGTTDYEPTYTLLRASQYLKDNRITPAGFDPHSVGDDTSPVGDCLDDGDFGNGSDRILFSIADLNEGAHTVHVELRHQAIGWAYVNDLRDYEGDPVVERFLDLYDQVLPGSELIAEEGFTIGD